MGEVKQWEFEEESCSDGVVWSVYDEHGDRLTVPYIAREDAMLIAAAPKLLEALRCLVVMCRAEGCETVPELANADTAIAKATAA